MSPPRKRAAAVDAERARALGCIADVIARLDLDQLGALEYVARQLADRELIGVTITRRSDGRRRRL